MHNTIRPLTIGRRHHAVAFSASVAVFFCSLTLSAFQEQKPAEAQAAAAKPATYVGSDTCAGCHDDIAKAFQTNPHVTVGTNKKLGWAGNACESCHGPGSKHAESVSPTDITNPAKLRPSATEQICLKCHSRGVTRIGRMQGGHAVNQVSCVACHSIHKGEDKLVPRRAAQVNALCSGCHVSVMAQFQRPHRHRLAEGAIRCVDCHNPHGSLLPRMVRTAAGNQPACVNCHGSLRGPFTFPHAPVTFERCSSCHEPHGSVNPRMLNRAEVRFVCLQCHSNLPVPQTRTAGVVPPAFHDLRSPRFRNCTICHQKIHGSYVDPNLLR